MAMAMAKLFILFALCVLPAVFGDRPLQVPYKVHGGVYCDTCNLGCQHKLTHPIAGAKVKIECTDSEKESVVYETYGVTNSEGQYTIEVRNDHQDEICEAVLVESSQEDCKKIVKGLDRATIIVTNNNGINSVDRYANNLGFQRDTNVAGCKQLVQEFTLASQDV